MFVLIDGFGHLDGRIIAGFAGLRAKPEVPLPLLTEYIYIYIHIVLVVCLLFSSGKSRVAAVYVCFIRPR